MNANNYHTTKSWDDYFECRRENGQILKQLERKDRKNVSHHKYRCYLLCKCSTNRTVKIYLDIVGKSWYEIKNWFFDKVNIHTMFYEKLYKKVHTQKCSSLVTEFQR